MWIGTCHTGLSTPLPTMQGLEFSDIVAFSMQPLASFVLELRANVVDMDRQEAPLRRTIAAQQSAVQLRCDQEMHPRNLLVRLALHAARK